MYVLLLQEVYTTNTAALTSLLETWQWPCFAQTLFAPIVCVYVWVCVAFYNFVVIKCRHRLPFLTVLIWEEHFVGPHKENNCKKFLNPFVYTEVKVLFKCEHRI